MTAGKEIIMGMIWTMSAEINYFSKYNVLKNDQNKTWTHKLSNQSQKGHHTPTRTDNEGFTPIWLPACSCVAESSSQRQTAVTHIVGACGAMVLPHTGSAFLKHN